MLSAVTPETLARLRFPLGELTKPRVRELAAEAGLAVASKAESQDLCFLAGTGKAAFLARHARARRPPGGDRRPRRHACSARHRGAHHFTVGQRKGLGVAAPEPLYVLATDAGFEPRRGRAARGARHDARSRLRGARLHRAAAEVDRVKLRYRSRAVPCRVAAEHGRGRVELELLEPVDGAAPGQTACLLRGDVVVGWGTIAAPRLRCHGDDHRRDPRALPVLLRGARPQAPALVPADPARQRHLDAADHRRHAAAQAVAERPRAPAARAPDRRPEGLPHARHRGGRLDLEAPDLLRDDGQLLDRRLLQAGARPRFAWDLSIEGFGLNPDDIWVTVFEGDPQLGIGLDEEAVDAWLEIGVPRERIVPCNRKENFWESGPTGLCGPCSELYLDRGLDFGKADDLPGGDNERFMEYWNLVFMQYDQEPRNTLTPLPAKNIDTGLGLERLASLLQGVPSVFETDAFRPLVGLGEELSGRSYGTDFPTDRALRILADHARGMSFLLADGVVPSNEGRGYPLRRIMRRAIVQGRRLGIEGQILAAVRGPRARRDGRRLSRSWRSRRRRSRCGSGARRSSSRARSSRARGCSTSTSRAPRTAGWRASAPRRRSSCTTPTASRSS